MASSKREARVAIVAHNDVDRGVRDAQRSLRNFQRDQDRTTKAALQEQKRRVTQMQRGMLGAAGSVNKTGGGIVGSILFGAAGIAGAAGLGSMVSDVFDFEKEMTRFQIDAQLSASKVAEFRNQITDTSSKLGVSRQAILEGAHAYQILTGDAEGAVAASKLFAEVANASGASMEDIAAVAGSFKQNLKLDPKDFRAGFDTLLTMGHMGSVELRDFAGELSGIAPMFAQFGAGGQLKGLQEMGAAMQVIRHGFANASETATGFRSLMTGIVKRHAELEKVGIQVFDPKTGNLRDFMAILDDVAKHKLGLKGLMDELKRTEGVRAALELVSDEGNARMHEFYSTAVASNQVAKDNNTYMESAAGKLAAAWEKVKNGIAQAFTPERIDHFVDAMVKITNLASQFIAWMSGPSQEDQANVVAKNLLDEGDDGIEHAKRILQGDTGGLIGMTRLGAGSEEAAKEGARKRLEAEGMHRDEFGNWITAEDRAAGIANQRGRANEIQQSLDKLNETLRELNANMPANFTAVPGRGTEPIRVVATVSKGEIASAHQSSAAARLSGNGH